MKIKRMTAAMLSLILAVTMLSGCESSKQKKYEAERSSAQARYDELIASYEEEPPIEVDEPDFLGFLTGTSDTNFYDMSFEEFVQATDEQLTADNAVEYDADYGHVRYYFGEKDSILCGRLKLPEVREVYCDLYFKKNKLKQMNIRVDGFTEEEAIRLCDDYLAALDGKFPEGYEQVTPSTNGGNICIVGYGKGVDDYLATLKRNYFSGNFYIEFTLDVYSERYGMDK